ncbi:uncharacterized protein C8Q71DRAFT_756910 [Rhodofomes roseus]|uniref:Uncharacterized protein n=1 Tax=Rhodofomes roseus TaxID=34475 RepID=A0ABQ8KHB6_9APHY|nr:uncharacterized protein C8Q71DRAFT_756910 [Rhodofomes roseus]KAH9837134.1 hypothetical protein C8Q71DRAFT_756910 [Rhodofomes roseus]
MVHPIQWLDSTFSSRARTEELLRPDLEAGLITPHDYSLATTFLPASHRYWPYVYSVAGSAALGGYLRFYRKPPASINRTTLFATFAGFAGAAWGHFRRAEAHATFTSLLDDPVTFSQALENVNRRTGGVRPLGWTLQRAREIARREDVHGNSETPSDNGWSPEAVAGDQPVSLPASASRPAPATVSEAQNRPKSRWGDIRAANTRGGAQQSSWDVLRQSHERNKIDTDTPEGRPAEETSRTDEQAQFDALLEAERRLSGRGS